jgi:hypothetical protein
MNRPFEPHPYPKSARTADAVVGIIVAGWCALAFLIGWSIGR